MHLLVRAIRKFMIWYHVVHLHPGVINGIIDRSTMGYYPQPLSIADWVALDNCLFAFSLLNHFGTGFFVPYRQYLPHVACFHEPLYGFLKTLYYLITVVVVFLKVQ